MRGAVLPTSPCSNFRETLQPSTSASPAVPAFDAPFAPHRTALQDSATGREMGEAAASAAESAYDRIADLVRLRCAAAEACAAMWCGVQQQQQQKCPLHLTPRALAAPPRRHCRRWSRSGAPSARAPAAAPKPSTWRLVRVPACLPACPLPPMPGALRLAL